MRPKGCNLSDTNDDFRKKILSVFLFFLAFGLIAYLLVFFTGKPSAPIVVDAVKPRENPETMTDPSSGTALTYLLGADGGVIVREGLAVEKEADEKASTNEVVEKKSEPVKEQPANKAEFKPKATAEKKTDTIQPTPKSITKPTETVKNTQPAKASVTKPAETKVTPTTVKKVEQSATKTPAPVAKPATVKAGMYVLQLSAYKTEAAATAEMNRLRKNFPDIYLAKIDLGDKGVWYRLRTSPSATQAEAIKKRDAVNSKYGLKAIVVKSE
jgi:cell division septation protein DedD